MELLQLMICVVLLSFFGTALGIITGLTPGIHVNLVAASFIALHGHIIMFVSLVVGWAEPTESDLIILVCCVIVANAVSHTFLDYIPSIFLGAPDADTALSVLPGHRMLLKGRGYDAVLLSSFGSLTALLVFVCLLVPVRFLMGSPLEIYDKISWSIPLILVTIVMMLIVGEQTKVENCRSAIRCESDGFLSGRHEFLRIQRLVGPGPARYSSSSLFRAVVVEGTISQIGSGYFVLLTDSGTLTIRFEDSYELSEGDKVYAAGILEPHHTYSQALKTRSWALAVFLLSGLLGFAVLSTGLFDGNWYPIPDLVIQGSSSGLFPLFTGLFGFSTLILSLARSQGIPPQVVDVDERKLLNGRFKSGLKGAFAGCFAGWFPGMSNATATVLAKMLDDRKKKESEKEFIVAVSAVNTSSCFFTILALFVLLRARSGVMNAVMVEMGDSLLQWTHPGQVPLALTTLLLSGTIAASLGYLLTRRIGRRFAVMTSGSGYRRLVLTIVSLLLVMVAFLGGIVGLVVAALATCVGVIPPLVGVKRVHLMGSLILPLLILFAG